MTFGRYFKNKIPPCLCNAHVTLSIVRRQSHSSKKATLLTVKSCKKHTCCECELKRLPYSLPSVGPRADPGVQAVSLQVTISHPPGSRLLLLFARPAVTFPAAEHHHTLAGTKLYCLVAEAHRYEQFAQGCYAVFAPSRI